MKNTPFENDPMMRASKFPFEALIWLTGLVLLASVPPEAAHFSICPIANLGFDFCPGCGLGRSVSLLFHGRLAESFSAHPFGIFAVIVLTYRIFNLTRGYLKQYGTSN